MFAGHDGGVSTGCFSSDGKMVCSGGEDGTVRFWAPKTGACKQVFDGRLGHDGLVTCMVACPYDPDLLLSGTYVMLSLCYHYVITMLSLYCHYIVTIVSQCYHCVIMISRAV